MEDAVRVRAQSGNREGSACSHVGSACPCARAKAGAVCSLWLTLHHVCIARNIGHECVLEVGRGGVQALAQEGGCIVEQGVDALRATLVRSETIHCSFASGLVAHVAAIEERASTLRLKMRGQLDPAILADVQHCNAGTFAQELDHGAQTDACE